MIGLKIVIFQTCLIWPSINDSVTIHPRCDIIDNGSRHYYHVYQARSYLYAAAYTLSK